MRRQLGSINALWLGLLVILWIVSPFRMALDGTSSGFVTPFEVLAAAVVALVAVLLSRQGNRYSWSSVSFVVFLLLASGLLQWGAHKPGLFAAYYANENFAGDVEREWHFPELNSATRIDATIGFTGAGLNLSGSQFPLYFLNNDRRFGDQFGDPQKLEARHQFLFSARWAGFLHIPEGVSQITLSSTAGEAMLVMAGQVVHANDSSESIAVASGTQPVLMAYSRKKSEAPSLVLSWQRDDRVETIPARYFSQTETGFVEKWIVLLNYVLHALIAAAFLWFCSGLDFTRAIKCERESLLLWLSAVVAAAVFWRRSVRRGSELSDLILPAGNDWLGYETRARDILAGDWLGRQTTGDQPFFWNILYPYLLAGMHFVFGENPLLMVWVQFLVLVALLVATYLAVRHLYGRRAAIFLIVIVVAAKQLFIFPRDLLDTTFGLAFSSLALLSLLLFRRTCNGWYVFGAGLLLGLASVTRANLFPGVVIGFCWIVFFCQSVSLARRAGFGAALVVMGLLPSVLAGVRNVVVADHFIMMPVSGGFNFWLAHRFNEFKDFAYGGPNMPPQDAFYSSTFAMIVADPAGLLQRTWLKFLHLMGFDAIHRFRVCLPILVSNVVFGLSVVFLCVRRRFVAETVLLLAWVAMVWAGLLVIFPWGYGWRLAAPAMLAMYLVIALAFDDIHENYLPRARSRRMASSQSKYTA